MIRSTDEWEMSRSCQRATSSSAATACPRTTRAMPEMRSAVIGLRLWGIAELPFWPGVKASSASRSSVRWRWRSSVARRSSELAATAIAQTSWACRSRATTWVATGSPSIPSSSSTRASMAGSSSA